MAKRLIYGGFQKRSSSKETLYKKLRHACGLTSMLGSRQSLSQHLQNGRILDVSRYG